MENTDSSSQEELVTMVDVERHQNEVLEELSNKIGGDDTIKCSYEKDYLPIQGVTICLTCQPQENEMAGICSACAIKCHKDHETYQIGPKRYF